MRPAGAFVGILVPEGVGFTNPRAHSDRGRPDRDVTAEPHPRRARQLRQKVPVPLYRLVDGVSRETDDGPPMICSAEADPG